MLHFIGVVSFGAPLPASATLEQAARRLGGADFEPARHWQAPDVMFAWRRLPLRAESVMAPIPVVAREGAVVLIGSGRIDERDTLIAALDLPVRGWTDTELMLASFSRWGEAGADRLMGNFGFAVWDRAARRLVLAKDYVGTVPMFYHRGDGFVVFGTNPAALLALGLFSRDLDAATLGETLMARPSADPEATLYRALRRVRRGATMAFDPGGARQTVYWRPTRGPVLKLKNDDAYVEATRAMLDAVMRGHARSLHPIGVMLSGGFDSGAVASTLARLMPEREILGFTTVPVAGDPAHARGQGREWEHVQALASMHPNLRVQAVAEKSVTPLDADFRDLFADTGLPLAGLSLMTRRLALTRAARAQGVRTMLNGDAGNRTLSAEGEEVFAELFRAGRWLALAREVLGTARFTGRPLRDVLWTEALRDVVPRGLLRAWRGLKGTVPAAPTADTFLKPEFAEEAGLQDNLQRSPYDPGTTDLRPLHELQPVYLDAQPSYADAITLAHHRMGIGHVAPLRDRRLVDFILMLPATQFRRNGVIRFLARRVLADRLPPGTLAERDYFESFADQEHWLAGWWEEAARRVADRHPAALAEAAIDLPALRACLAKGPPAHLPRSGPERKLIGALANALHIDQFLRWHQGMND